MRCRRSTLALFMMITCFRMQRSMFFLTFLVVSILGLTILAAGASAQTTPAAPRGKAVPYLGAFIGDVTEGRLAELKLTEVRGAVIGRVIEDSPAEKAGLKVGDVLLTFRGENIEGREHFYRLLNRSAPGRLVTLGISRDGARQNVHVALATRRGAADDEPARLFAEPDEIRRAGEKMALEAEEARQKGNEKEANELALRAAALIKQAEEGRAEIEKLLAAKAGEGSISGPSSYSLNANRHLLGVTVKPLNPQLAAFFHVSGGSGLLVTEVKPGGLVDRAGIIAGDCIITLNGKGVQSLQDMTRQMSTSSRENPAAEVVFTIVRDRVESTVKAKVSTQ